MEDEITFQETLFLVFIIFSGAMVFIRSFLKIKPENPVKKQPLVTIPLLKRITLLGFIAGTVFNAVMILVFMLLRDSEMGYREFFAKVFISWNMIFGVYLVSFIAVLMMVGLTDHLNKSDIGRDKNADHI